MDKLLNNANRFKLSSDEIATAEKDRLSFIEKFPKEKLPFLKIEEYANHY
ncbi:MAG: hypothetical protein JSS81_09620 [Acidobacteria bacterium]|nr:hypothetical protein [Acidobacteriota bacterium]